jgi:hypothetical protein
MAWNVQNSTFAVMTDDALPIVTFDAIELLYQEDASDCDTLTVKGILRQPPQLAGYTFRVEMGIPSHRLNHLCNLMSSLPHENIVEVFARGNDFIVTSFWNETLKCFLRRVEPEIKENQPRSCGQNRRRRKGTNTINLWRSVALPVTKAVSFLHAENVTLGGALDLTTIVVNTQNNGESKELLTVPAQVYLRDFSKAHQASVTAMDQLYQTEFLSEDTFQLGTILSEISLVQPLPRGEAAEQMDEIIDMCCHPDPCLRPSVRRVEKTLMEVLRHPDLRPTTSTKENGSAGSVKSSKSSSSPKPSNRGWLRFMFPKSSPAFTESGRAVPALVQAGDSSTSSADLSENQERFTKAPIPFWRRPFSRSPSPDLSSEPPYRAVHITVATRGEENSCTSSTLNVEVEEMSSPLSSTATNHTTNAPSQWAAYI